MCKDYSFALTNQQSANPFEPFGNFCVLHGSSDCFTLFCLFVLFTFNHQAFHMNQRALIAAAAASLLSTVMISTGVNAASHAAAPAAHRYQQHLRQCVE